MFQKCVVSGCKETDANTILSFYSFPEDKSMRNRWLMAIRKNDALLDNSVICSKHFLPEGFRTNALGNKTLKPDSVPSIFSIQDHYHEIEKIKQKFLKDRQILRTINKRRSSLGRCLPSKGNSENAEPNKNLEQQSNATEKDTNSTQDDLDFIEDDIIGNTNQFDYINDSTDDLELPDDIIQIQRLIAYQRFKCRKQSRTLQQKIRRQNFKIKKQYELIRDLCSHLSKSKKHQSENNNS